MSHLLVEVIQKKPRSHILPLGDGTIVHKKKSGDVVVCNLGSINLVRYEDGNVVELPQEMYMLIAMTLCPARKEGRKAKMGQDILRFT